MAALQAEGRAAERRMMKAGGMEGVVVVGVAVVVGFVVGV